MIIFNKNIVFYKNIIIYNFIKIIFYKNEKKNKN
jgi:hypothetical protein